MFSDFVLGLILLAFFLFPLCAIAYKYREQIKRWVKVADYGDLRIWNTPRILRAQRDIIKAQWKLDDARAYAEYLQSEETKEETEPKGGDK